MPHPLHTAPSILAADGPIAGRLGPEFEPRPQQLDMARAITETMEAKGRLLVEAGTGVGKSFAYLVPAILRCILKGERVVVATNTIALQEQLVQKDIPFLQSTMEEWRLPAAPGAGAAGESPLHALKAVLVKGRGNYVSIRRLQLASKRQASLFPDEAARRSLYVIEDWAGGTRDGTLSTLPPLERGGVWDRVQSDSGNCMGRRCPSYEDCFYQTARREMESANLLVCNHALFFSDLALRAKEAGFLPPYQHVILDEAHNIEDVASEHFGLSLTEGRVQHLLGVLAHARTGKGFLHALAVTDDRMLDGAKAAVYAAEQGAGAFFDGVLDAYRRGKFPGGRIPPPGGAGVGGAGVDGAGVGPGVTIANPLSGLMSALSVRLKGLREVCCDVADKFELVSYAERTAAVADAAEALVTQSISGSVYWVEGADGEAEGTLYAGGRRVGGGGAGGGGGGGAKLKIACSPIEVGPLLHEHLFSKELGIVLTSATLATRTVDAGEHKERAETAFAHAMGRMGIKDARTLQLDSPFDYATQCELMIDVSMPTPRGSDRDPFYTRALADRIVHHVTETGGGAFVLFTSHSSLVAAADALGARLSRLGFPMLVQGRGASRGQILQEFRESGRAVLLGAASFWQGVDVRGRGLRNVIITRLPFDPPDRPLTQARLERIKARGGNPFAEESLPRAVIRFKQGFGRLIRSRSDTGRVVVLDPRLATARYGRAFTDALPAGLGISVIE